jgi:SAM-dependent methyltransferase
MVFLNLGCGKDIRKNYVNFDRIRLPGVDVQGDLDKGLPFKTSCVDKIVFRYVLEHFIDIIPPMAEIHRVLKSGGTVYIEVPHCSWVGAYTDLTHRSFFSYQTMDVFDDGPHYGFFLDVKSRFKIIEKKLHFSDHPKLAILNAIINPIINRFPFIYERFFLWILPVNKIIFLMKALK